MLAFMHHGMGGHMSEKKITEQPDASPEPELRDRKLEGVIFAMGKAVGRAEERAKQVVARRDPIDEFPVDALPPSIANVILALHTKFQAPLALCAQSVLSAVVLAVQGLGNVRLPYGASKPVSCFFLTLGTSGERKTATDGAATKAIDRYQDRLREVCGSAQNEYEEELYFYKKAYNSLKKDHHDAASFRSAFAASGLTAPIEPLTHNVILTDISYAGLVKKLEKAQLSAGVYSDEGGRVLGSSAMKQDSLLTITLLSSLWDGEPVEIIRGNSGGSLELRGRRLSIHLLVQPGIVAKILGDGDARDQGFLARFLMTHPTSTIGERLYKQTAPQHDDTIDEFAQRLEALLDLEKPMRPGSRNELLLPDLEVIGAAAQAWADFVNEVEVSLKPEGQYANIKDFGSKAAENAARLAAAVTLYNDPKARSVSPEAMATGISLMRYYLHQALKLCGGADPNEELADVLEEWLIGKWQEDHISASDVAHDIGSKKLRNAEAARRAIAILVARGRLTPAHGKVTVAGKIRRDAWRINRGE